VTVNQRGSSPKFHDDPGNLGFEKSMATLVELFGQVVELANRSLDGFRGRRIHLTIEEDAVVFTAMLYAERALFVVGDDARAKDAEATARSLPRGANADLSVDAAGAALTNALLAARAARGDDAAGIMRQLRLLSRASA
jgi:hypothetical protein